VFLRRRCATVIQARPVYNHLVHIRPQWNLESVQESFDVACPGAADRS